MPNRAAMFALLILTSCATGSSGPTPKASVLALESGLTGAERLARQYTRLAPCTGINGPLCKDAGTVAIILDADNRAYVAVTTAQASVDADPTASSSNTKASVASATAALNAFQSAVAQLPTAKGP